MANRQEQYNAEVEALLRESRNVSRETARALLDRLQDARAEIIARVAALRSSGDGGFAAAQLEEVVRQIDAAMREFAQRAGLEVRRAQERQWNLGEEVVDRPLIGAGESSLLFRLDPTRLAQWQRYSSTLISGISRETAGKLEALLRRASIGGQQIGDIVNGIQKLLDSTLQRAEDIAFNEINRMQSISTYERLQQMAARLGNRVQKQWRHNGIGKPRPGHVALHGTTLPVNEAFHVPLGERVGTGREEFVELRYPRDPLGPPGETINCHCTIVPHVVVPERENVPRLTRVSVTQS